MSIAEKFKNFVQKLADTFLQDFKEMAVKFVISAEERLEGATGAEKREVVVKQLDSMVKLHWILEPLDDVLIGALVDSICDKLNLLCDHDWSALLTSETAPPAVAAASLAPAADTDVSVEDVAATVEGAQTLDEKLDRLYQRYGVGNAKAS